MINIYAGGITICCNLLHEAEFKSLSRYKTDKKCEFFLNSEVGTPIFSKMERDFETEYFEIYKTENGMYQLQRYGDNIIGGILYQNKTITCYLFNDTYQTEYLLTQYAFVYWIRHYTKSLFIHSSSIMVNDRGFLLCAKSGTGKSTHRRLWEQNGAICINDDKNVISLIDDKLYIMPNPWSGKHYVDNNFKTELKALVFLYQNKENVVERLDEVVAMKLLLGQIQLPSKESKDNWSDIVDKLLSLRLLKLGCNMEMEAYEVLEKKLEDVLYEKKGQ